MSQNDYIILRDEDGKAYIAHAGLLDNARNAISTAAQQVANKAKGVGRGVRQNHKYILKVLENGKTRYFYKQEEVKAYYEAKKRGIKNPAEYAQKAVDAVKNATSKAGNAAKSAFREATGQAARDRMDAAAEKYPELENNRRKKKQEYSAATYQADRASNKLADAYANARVAEGRADRSNIFNRKQRNNEADNARKVEAEARREFDEAVERERDAMIRSINANQKYANAKIDYDKNKAAYDKSLAGAVDRTAARARETAANAKDTASSAFNRAKDAANNTVSNAKNAYERMKGEFRDRAEQAGNAVKSTAKNAVDKAKDIAGYDEKERFDKAAEKATDSVKGMIDQAKRTARDAAASAQSAIDNATGNNYRKRAQEANQAAENAINQRARTSDQLENQRSKYGSKTNDSDHIYGDSEGYYYKTQEQRDRAESLISKRDHYDADIVNNNRASKVNDSMYADSKAGRINSLLGRETSSTSERSNSKATEVNNKWDRQEAESKLIGGRLDPSINVSKEYVYSRASNSGMASEVSKVMKLEEAMRSAERAYERLSEDSSKPHSSSRAARNKMLDAQKAYNEAYEELIDDINKQYDRDLAAYEKQYGKYNR